MKVVAKLLEITDEYKPYLSDSDTGESCVTEKVVEVTDDCPGADDDDRCIFLYTRSKRGRIVQMTRPFPGREYTGKHIHFFIDELEREMCASSLNDTFGSWAHELRLTKSELLLLIRTHAPVA